MVTGTMLQDDPKRRSRVSVRCALFMACILLFASPTTAEELKVFFGDLHTHTGFSDGVGTPAEAYAMARDAANLDFLYLSDHGYFLRERADHWQETQRAAAEFTEPGRFVAGFGVEWTDSTNGHMNVFDGQEFPDRDNQGTHGDLYAWLAAHEALGQFNHPNFEFQRNWDSFAYDWTADRYVNLLEVGSGHFPRNIIYECSYRMALDNGWRVGAVAVSDTHRADWGLGVPVRTGIWGAALTKEELDAALWARRVFATEDRNASVYFKSGEVWMGSTLPLAETGFQVEVADGDGEGFSAVQLISARGVEKEIPGDGAPRVSWRFFVRPQDGYEWYYIRAVQTDGDRVVSSPIWLENSDQVIITSLKFASSMNQVGRTGNVEGLLINNSAELKPSVQVSFAWDNGENATPAGTVEADLLPGEVRPFSVPWTPTEVGDGVLVARVEKVGGRPADEGNRYEVSLTIHPEHLPTLVVDEGHNNRYTGAADGFLTLLKSSGIEAQVNTGPFSQESLRGVDVLVVANPEEGLSLLPNFFAPEEIKALVEYVQHGGNLVLAAASDSTAFSGPNGAELNRLLGALGSTIRIGDDEIRRNLAAQGETSRFAVRVLPVGPWEADGKRRIYLQAAAGLILQTGSEASPLINGDSGLVHTDGNNQGEFYQASGESLVLGALERIGKGIVVVLGAPPYSVYELEQADNAALVLDLVQWLIDSAPSPKGEKR